MESDTTLSNRFRPNESVVELECYAVVQSICGISSTEGTFTCSSEVWTWLWLSESEYRARAEDPSQWRPNVVPYPRAYNGVDVVVEPILGANGLQHHVRRTKTGQYKALFGWDLTARYGASFHLRLFPMDIQKLVVDIQFNNYTDSTEVEYKFDLTWVDPRFGKFFLFEDPVWTLDRNHIKRTIHSDTRHYEMRIYIKRNSGYYVSRVMLLQGLLAFMGVVVFIFGEDTFVDRVNFIVALIFATIAFLFIVQGDLPKLSYMTIMDEYIYAAFGLYFVIVMQCILAKYLPVLDVIFLILDCGVVTLWHIFYYWRCSRAAVESEELLVLGAANNEVKTRLFNEPTFSESQYMQNPNQIRLRR
jgi:hypothetical protein